MGERWKLIYSQYLYKKAMHYIEHKQSRKALRYLLKMKKLPLEQNMNSVLLMHLGDVYNDLHHYKRALDAYLEVEKLNNNRILQKKIAYCLKSMRNLPLFIEVINRYLETETNLQEKAEILIDISFSYRMLENFESALEYSNRALILYEELYPYNSFEVGNSHLAIALVYLDNQKYLTAVEYLEKTEEIYENIDIAKGHLLNLYEKLEYAFFHLGYKDTAVFYSGKYNKLIKS